MRPGLVLLSTCALLAGCGGARTDSATTAPARTTLSAPASGLRVGVVGPLALDVQGARADRGSIAEVANAPLVLVDARSSDLATVATAARTHPGTHFALVGASTADDRVPNLVGLVLQEDQSAYLAGVAAGIVAADDGGATPRVAWVGPEERKLAAAFGRGVHAAAPDVAVLHQWSRQIAARCKEAALIGLDRGATLVMTHSGVCADAAVAAAHQQNLPALRLSDFELPSVAAAAVVRDAVNGVYHGNEDILFGSTSGAVGIRRLDPRIPLTTAARARASAQSLQNGIPPAG